MFSGLYGDWTLVHITGLTGCREKPVSLPSVYMLDVIEVLNFPSYQIHGKKSRKLCRTYVITGSENCGFKRVNE